jgi:hypothetical protein
MARTTQPPGGRTARVLRAVVQPCVRAERSQAEVLKDETASQPCSQLQWQDGEADDRDEADEPEPRRRQNGAHSRQADDHEHDREHHNDPAVFQG